MNIFINGNKLPQILENLISNDGLNNTEIGYKIAQENIIFQKTNFVTNKQIFNHTRRRALEVYIEPILMYR